MIYKRKLRESINFQQLNNRIKKSGTTDEDKIFSYILKTINPNNDKLTDTDLRAHGSSKKELKNAIKGVLMWNKAEEEKDEIAKAEALQFYVRNVNVKKGKLDDSYALKMAKQLLDNLSDAEYQKVMDLLDTEGEKALQTAPYRLFSDENKALFMLNDEETSRFFKAKSQNIKGLVDKGKAKRKLKKAAKDVAGKVSGAVDKVVGSVKDKYKKIVDAGKYVSGWLT